MPDLKIRITSDSSEARSDIQGFGDLMGRAALPAAAAGAAIIAFGADAVGAASEAQQAAGALEAVFGDSTASMSANAEAAAGNLGLSGAAYSQLAATIGAQLGNMGVAQDQVAGTTDGLISKGADLAAQFGGSTADAVAALSSLMRGERDPIEKYGVSISAAAVEAEKARLGLSGLTGEADRAATTQATLSLLNEQTATSAGAFARETDTAAGAQAIATASYENATATLGTALLPAVTAAAQGLADLATWIQDNSTLVLILVGVVGALAAGVLIYNGVMAVAQTATAVATAAQWAWNAAMAANPLGLIIIAVLAVIAAIVLLVQNWDTVKRVALDVWNQINAAVAQAATWLTSRWEAAVTTVQGFFTDFASTISRTVDGVVDFFTDIPGKIARAFSRVRIPSWLSSVGSFFGFTAPASALTMAAGAATFAATTPVGAPGLRITAPSNTGTVINIQVDGALDPRAVARQIRDLLNYDARVAGRVSISGTVL